MEHVRSLFAQGKMEQIKIDVTNIIQDSKYEFFDFEGKFINTGNLLINQNQYNYAIQIFSFIAQVYTDSDKSWKGLADGYKTLVALEKAEEFYKKASFVK
tara:strand:+ start:202 stop:501 length:300 start_codon:yes stop_codon:yes gene_type:complete